MKSNYDIGLFGVWTQCNYGSMITYYALNKALTELGASVLMIDKPVFNGNEDIELTLTHSRKFAKEHYNISEQLPPESFWKFNYQCDQFMVGSDQLWNFGISSNFGKLFYLDFVSDTKRKVSYATSFGHQIDFAPQQQQKLLSGYFKRFNALSVREDDGVRILETTYHVKSEQVIDPVFLIDTENYEAIASKSFLHEHEPYIFSCIIDPTDERKKSIQELSKQLGDMKVINVLDGCDWLFEEKQKQLGLKCESNIHIEDWLNYIKNAEIIITDSYHAMCMAMIFRKKFIALPNEFRGFSRFDSIARLLGIKNHYAYQTEDISKCIAKAPDYSCIGNLIEEEKKRCLKWLLKATKN